MSNELLSPFDVPPPVLYKYTPIGKWLPALLGGESLRFSNRTSFNDPFDCRPAFRVGKGKEVRKAVSEGLKGRGLSPAKRIMAATRAVNMGDKYLSLDATNVYLDEIGVLCLAPTWDKALMWSHYANHHKGICVGFHSNIDVFMAALPVVYQSELPVISAPAQKGRELFNKTFLTKDDCWKYEQEWRIIKANLNEQQRDEEFREYCCYTDPAFAKSLADQRGAGIYVFRKEAIESITLGMRISATDEKAVREAVAVAGLTIPIYKIQLPSGSYALQRERR